MSEPPDVIVGKIGKVWVALSLAFSLWTVLEATTAVEFEEWKRWFLWVATPFFWLCTVSAFLIRYRVDEGGIEVRIPLVGEQRIEWEEIAAVYDVPLVAGKATGVRSVDGREIAIPDIVQNYRELEAAVIERSGVQKTSA